jgi:hypothetical protein
MTTHRPNEAFNRRAQLYQAGRLLADVECKLWPPDAPLHGAALVPGQPDRLWLGTLLLAMRSGERYRIIPTALDQVPRGESVLTFGVGPRLPAEAPVGGTGD